MLARSFHAARLLIATILCLTLGCHWAVLQTVAWAGMLVTYARQTNGVDAVGKTFDGEHPCKLCIKLRESRKSKEREPATAELAKLDLKFLKPEPTPVVEPTSRPIRWTTVQQSRLALNHKPPVPPPRRAA